ncbi:MAG: UDP-N-acetylmuramoyl-L-alanine--D-glutamate ligase [Lachnospiraceae bacterium]
MNIKGKKFLVVGTGISGIAATELLVRHHHEVVLYDGNDTLEKTEIRKRAPSLAQVEILLGAITKEELLAFDIAVLSPGVPTDSPMVTQMKELGIIVWGEIELGFAFEQGAVLAVTGTNGKTTTTALLGEIMKHYFNQVQVVGNIGIPYTQVADQTTPQSVTVAEISSFQLETIHEFCPQISAILNITPDHLNRHHTMEAYIAAKEHICSNQSANQICVLNYEDEVLRKFAEKAIPKIVFFSSRRTLKEGIYLEKDNIIWSDGRNTTQICSCKELLLIGRHNYENVMAATAMALSFGVPIEKIKEVLVCFVAVAHRIEYVVTKRGVRFYNDSKGTNPDAAIQAINAMEWPTCLIGGGYDKNSEYESWIESFHGKVKKLVLLGATREKIAATAVSVGYPKENILFAESLEEAVELCYTNAVSGDAVLLSPACASWGMFKNYEQRGDMFKEIVNALSE